MPRDEATLLDIAKAARVVRGFVRGFTREAFLSEPKTQSAVLYQLIVVGEAVKRLSPEFRAQHPRTPWSLVAAMRDHLTHGYDVVDWQEVWKTVTTDVPELLSQIEPCLPKETGE